MMYVLGAFSTLALGLDMWQLVRLHQSSLETGLKYAAKRLFHWVLGASLFGRAFFFFVTPSVPDSRPWLPLYTWLNHTLAVLFFFAFFLPFLVPFFSSASIATCCLRRCAVCNVRCSA